MVTPYEARGDGVLVPQWPAEGLCRDEPGPCCLVRNHERQRKTGPGPVVVARCTTHKRAFTLYPPGYAPYERSSLTPVAMDGSMPVAEEPGAEGFRGTVFDAALEAAAGEPWRTPSTDRWADWRGSGGAADADWWSTQHRRLARVLALVGVAPDLPESAQHAIAILLAVDALLLIDAADGVAEGDRRERGRAVCRVLAALQRTASLTERLTCAGHRVGLWGQPLFWDASAGGLKPMPFRSPGTRAPPEFR